jgi:hypothetical protein
MRVVTRAILLAALLQVSGAALAQPGMLGSDVAGFSGTDQSLVQALDMFQRLSGGRVIEIRYAPSGGQPGYSAVVAKGDRIEYYSLLDPESRLVTIDEHSLPDWMLSWRQSRELHFGETAPVRLATAIGTAEREDHGAPAIAAGIARSAADPLSDIHAYNVLVDDAGTERRVAVDDATGKVITDPQAFESWP